MYRCFDNGISLTFHSFSVYSKTTEMVIENETNEDMYDINLVVKNQDGLEIKPIHNELPIEKICDGKELELEVGNYLGSPLPYEVEIGWRNQYGKRFKALFLDVE
jgi:hypothetical protein